MLDILSRWNRWGSATLDSGIERDILARILPFLSSKEIVVLMGPRRAGKTTVLFQIMDELENQSIPKEAMLHINFEEPALAPALTIDLLNQIYESYRNDLYPKGTAYLFLDEIQNVPQWERWVRARNESEDIKFFITGSSSQLMSRELATLLTGRHISFSVLPLSFKEFLRFKSIALPKKPLITVSPIINHALKQYLQWGGFPAVVLAESEEVKELLLKQYLDDILFKDVALRHAVRDAASLRNLVVYLLTQTASIVSFQRIAKLFNVSLDLASAYCRYLQEAFLVEFVPFYSEKVGVRLRNPHKVHAGDLGLRRIASLAHSADDGHLLETAVFHALQRKSHDGIFYWKGEKEVDLLLRQGNSIQLIVQAVYEGLDQPEIWEREVSALSEAQARFKNAQAMIVMQKMSKRKDRLVKVVPLWKLLME